VLVHVAHVRQIDPLTLYRILQLRSAVFVVEQSCAYADMDGRDLDLDARQLWLERDSDVVATLRMLADPAGCRIGRVATAAAVRSEGLAGRLIKQAIEVASASDMVLDGTNNSDLSATAVHSSTTVSRTSR
jgi:ElaA protein